MPATARMESFCSRATLDPKEAAESNKEAANIQYKAQKYKEALIGYTKAIELSPDNPMYYGNRAACYMMLNQYQKAIKDAKKSVDLAPEFPKAYQRLIKCSIILGDLVTARYELDRLSKLSFDASMIEKEKQELEFLEKHAKDAQETYNKGDFRKAIYHLRSCCDISTACTMFKIRKAECWAALGKYEEAQEVANNILHIDLLNVDALYVRGMCLYFQDDLGKCIQLLQEVLRLAPDYTKAIDLYKTAKKLKLKAEEGNEAFKSCMYRSSYNIYTEALAIDPKNTATNARLYYNRGIAASKFGMTEWSINDWTSAINHNTNYVTKSLLRRGEAYIMLEEYDKAVADFERVCKLDESRDKSTFGNFTHSQHRRKLEEAIRLAARSKRKDYYNILGIHKNATVDDIKKAYKKKAKLHHPDRHVDAPERDKKKEEIIFKEISEAYSVLSDPVQRLDYDRGSYIFRFQDFGTNASSFFTSH